MGCCFSKELSSDDSEKTGLLQKSAEEEKELEKEISTALSSLFDPSGGRELHRTGLRASRAAAGANVCTGAFARPGQKQGCRLGLPVNSVSSSVCVLLARSENPDDTRTCSEHLALEWHSDVCGAPCVSTGSGRAFSEGACSQEDESVSCVQGVQEGTCVNNRLCHCPVTYENSMIQNEVAVNTQIMSDNENHSVGTSGREMKDENSICVGHQRCRSSQVSAPCSLCVMDPDGLGIADDMCAPRCGAAAPSKGICKGAWLPDNIAEGPRGLEAQQEELSPHGRPCPNAMKDLFDGETKPGSELLAASDPPFQINTSDMQTESLRANVHTRLLRNCREGSASEFHGVGTPPELNTNIDAGSLECACAMPKERVSHRPGLGSLMGGSLINLMNDTSNVEGNGEAGVVTASIGQSLHSERERENNSVKPPEGLSNLEVSEPNSLLSISSSRCMAPLSCGNEGLPVCANFQGVAPERPGDAPGPDHPLRSAVVEEQHCGDHGLETRSIQLANKGELSLLFENCSSYQGEGEVSTFEHENLAKRTFEWISHQVHFADTGASEAQAQAQICDVTLVIQGIASGCEFQRIDTPELRCPQEVPPNSKSLDGSRCLKSNFISFAFVFTCNEEEESRTGLYYRTEAEMCVKSSESDPHRLENTG